MEVKRSLRRDSTGLAVNPPKSARGQRRIELPLATVEVLRRHRRQQDEHKARYREVYEDNDLVFADETGGFVNPNALSRAAKDLGKRVGHPNLRNHDLRHFYASLMLGENVPIPEVSALLNRSQGEIYIGGEEEIGLGAAN